MDADDPVAVRSGHFPQPRRVRTDEFRPAFAEDAEDLRRFHTDLVHRVVQELLKDRHMVRIEIRGVRGDVFRRPDETEPDIRILIIGKAEQAFPVRFDDREAAPPDAAEGIDRALPQECRRTSAEGSNCGDIFLYRQGIYEAGFSQQPEGFSPDPV